MNPFILPLVNKLIGRLWNRGAKSKTPIATAGSVPVASVAAFMLIESTDPVMQFLGGVLLTISAGLLIYKDGNDE